MISLDFSEHISVYQYSTTVRGLYICTSLPFDLFSPFDSVSRIELVYLLLSRSIALNRKLNFGQNGIEIMKNGPC